MVQPRKNPDPVILSVRIDRKLLERLDQFGSRTGLTRAETVSEALDAKLPAKGSRTSPSLSKPELAKVAARLVGPEGGFRHVEVVAATVPISKQLLDENQCSHPKEALKHLAYGTFCMVCNRKVR